eukprot:1757684-Prymnesium_polylepis.1
MFERARLAPLPLVPGKAPCCAMPATCWPHPAWRRRLAFARGRRARKCRAAPNGRSRGRCAPTAA